MNLGYIRTVRAAKEAAERKTKAEQHPQTGPTIRQHINAFNKLIGNTSTPTKP